MTKTPQKKLGGARRVLKQEQADDEDEIFDQEATPTMKSVNKYEVSRGVTTSLTLHNFMILKLKKQCKTIASGLVTSFLRLEQQQDSPSNGKAVNLLDAASPSPKPRHSMNLRKKTGKAVKVTVSRD